jgi:hypothetical protein
MEFKDEIKSLCWNELDKLAIYIKDGIIDAEKFISNFQTALDKNPKDFAHDCFSYILKDHDLVETDDAENVNNILIECSRRIMAKYPEIISEHTRSSYYIDNLRHALSISHGEGPEKFNFTFSLLENYISHLETLDGKTISENTVLALYSVLYTKEAKTVRHQALIDRLSKPEFEKKILKCDLSKGQLEEELAQHYSDDTIDDGRTRFQKIFDGFPESERWRLFVDRVQQKEGWLVYEQREQGCIDAMSNAWDYIESTINALMTLEYVKKIHKIASSHTGNIEGGVFQGGFSFPLLAANMTIKGFKELSESPKFSYRHSGCFH